MTAIKTSFQVKDGVDSLTYRRIVVENKKQLKEVLKSSKVEFFEG